MTSDIRKSQLFRMKLYATALLVAMAVLFLVSRLNGRIGIWEWISAFAEAAMIGALADWFGRRRDFPASTEPPYSAHSDHSGKQGPYRGEYGRFHPGQFPLERNARFQNARLGTAQRIASWLSSKEKADFLADKTVRVLVGALEFVDDAPCRQAFAQFDLPAAGRTRSGRPDRAVDGCLDAQ